MCQNIREFCVDEKKIKFQNDIENTNRGNMLTN